MSLRRLHFDLDATTLQPKFGQRIDQPGRHLSQLGGNRATAGVNDDYP